MKELADVPAAESGSRAERIAARKASEEAARDLERHPGGQVPHVPKPIDYHDRFFFASGFCRLHHPTPY
jgi:hypothetical protein